MIVTATALPFSRDSTKRLSTSSYYSPETDPFRAARLRPGRGRDVEAAFKREYDSPRLIELRQRFRLVPKR